MSSMSPTTTQEGSVLCIAKLYRSAKKRVLWELPAGYGKSFVMLLVAALLIK